MVQQHLGIWMVNPHLYARPLRAVFVAVNMMGGAAAPLFITLAGVSAVLSAEKRMPGLEMFLRGAILMMIGYGLNVMTPSWFSLGSFYVLHLLGVWLLLVPLVVRMKTHMLGLLILIILVAGVLGQTWLETPRSLSNDMMRDTSKAGGALRLALWEGQFPVFPWLALAVAGAWAGRAALAGRLAPLFISAGVCLGLAAVLRCLVIVIPSASDELPYRALCRVGATFYPMSTVYALSLFSLCVGLLASFLWLERKGMLTAKSFLVPLGQTSLSLLVFHVVFFREGLIALDWRRGMALWLATVVIVAFIGLWTYLARSWGRCEYKYGLEWLLRRAG